MISHNRLTVAGKRAKTLHFHKFMQNNKLKEIQSNS
uniref:Uncharacterized protein n=1 Tax=Arundo donax TaxID=35708 RepID=A0A0A9AXG9_ARUDO